MIFSAFQAAIVQINEVQWRCISALTVQLLLLNLDVANFNINKTWQNRERLPCL